MGYVESTETFIFPLPVTTGGEFGSTTSPPASAQEVLQQSPDARSVVVVASLFDNLGNYVKIVPAAPAVANPTVQAIPYIILSVRQGPVGGETPNAIAPSNFTGLYQPRPVRPFVSTQSGSGQGTRYAHIVAPDLPQAFVVPAGTRFWANVRGARTPDPDVVPNVPFVNEVRLSVSVTSLVEPAADGQSKRIVEGIRTALVEVIAPSIVEAAKRLRGGY